MSPLLIPDPRPCRLLVPAWFPTLPCPYPGPCSTTPLTMALSLCHHVTLCLPQMTDYEVIMRKERKKTKLKKLLDLDNAAQLTEDRTMTEEVRIHTKGYHCNQKYVCCWILSVHILENMHRLGSVESCDAYY